MTETSTDTVKVFDTWVNSKQGRLHFDVMTTDEATALKLERNTLKTSATWRLHSEPAHVAFTQPSFHPSESRITFSSQSFIHINSIPTQFAFNYARSHIT